jgi:tetratricopeptide (TPR) repeat protein
MGFDMPRPILARLLGLALLLPLAACGPHSAQDYLNRGIAEMNKKDYAHARIDLTLAVHKNTLFTEAYYLNGVAAMELHEYAEAYDAFMVAERLDAKPSNEYYSVDLRLRLGLLMLYGRDYSNARVKAQWVLRRDPHNAKAHELMAFVFSALAQPQSATQELDEVLASEPRDLQARMMRASIYFASNEADEAIHQMQMAVEQTNRSPESLLALGNLYQIANQPEKATPLYREAIEKDPKNANAYIGLGWLYERNGNRPKAEETFREVAKVLPGDPDALMALGNFYLNQLELPIAIRELERIGGLNKSPKIQNRLAGAYYLAGQYDDAERTVRRLIVADDQNVDARLLLGMLYLRTSRNNEAVGEFNHVLHFRPDYAAAHFYLGISEYNAHNEEVALQDMEAALRLDPFLISARVWHAELLLSQDSPAAALAVLRDAPESQRDLPTVRLLRALCDEAMKNDAQALDEVRSVLAVDPKMVASFYSMGFGKLLDRHLDIAKQALELGLKADPAGVEILRVLARNYVVEGHSDQAINRVLSQMKLIKPTAAHYLLLGDVARVSAQYPSARDAFTKAASMAPESPFPTLGLLQTDLADGRCDSALVHADQLVKTWPTSALAWTWRGVTKECLKNYGEAQRSYEKALELDTNQAVAAHNLARRILVDGGDLSRALNWASRARDLQPANPIMADTLGWIYYKHGSFHFAEMQLRAAVKTQPANATFQYHLGAILSEQGSDKEAMAALREALRLDPKLPEADDAKRRIEEIKDRLTSSQ